MFKGHIAEGTVEGTGALITIQTGWIPSYVRVVNEDGLCVMEFFSNMTAGHGIKQVTVGTISKVTTGGISPYAGSAGANGAGFTIGTDVDINVAGETLHYRAESTDA
jgi:hypothetical protein